MGICLIGAVGQRPSAIAVVIKTLVDAGRPVARVVLLYRTATECEARAVCDWCAGLPVAVPCVVHRVDGEVCTEQAGTGTAARAALGPEPGEVVCLGDPGLSVDVALLALAFPEATFAHADLDELHLLRHGAEPSHERFTLSDIGFDDLMKLYALTPSVDERARTLSAPAGVSTDLRAGISFDGQYGFAFAYERRGHLHLLAHIHQREAGARRSAVRAALEYVNKNEMKRLRPILAGCCADEAPMTQFELANVAVFRDGSDEQRRWMLRDPPKPGSTSYHPDATTKPRSFSDKVSKRPEGLTKTLLVAAGRNPVPTLTSLCSHRPTNAWILYDETTPAVVEFVHGIKAAALAGCLPEELAAVRFIATDVLGTGIEGLRRELPEGGAGVEADLSPGSKAQAAALARLPVARRWTFKRDVYVDLRDGATRPVTPVGLGVVLAAARAFSDAFAPTSETRAFLQAFARALAACDVSRVPRFSLDDRESWSVQNHGWEITRTALDCGLADWLVASRTERWTSPQPIKGGELLEQCVAQLLLDAGATEVVTNVRFGESAATHVSEFDVAAVFGASYVGFSVKGGRDVSIATGRSQASVQVTRALGRLAIPVLVRRRVDPSIAAEYHDAPLGTLLVDFKDLLDGAAFQKFIKKTASARRTTVADPE